MKTQFKLLLFAALLLAGFQGRCQCNATFNYTVNTGGNVTFIGNSYFDSTSSYYTIDFGDGSTPVTMMSFLYTSHTYASSGVYTVCVQDSDILAACYVTSCDTVAVNPCRGASQYSYSTTGFGEIAFSAPNLAALSGATVLWNFGDGNTSTAVSPTHQFSASGNYPVCLTVTYAGGGCADTTCNNGLPVSLCSFNPGFDTADLSFNPAIVGFYAQYPHSTYTYSWSFGDGGTGTGDSIDHSFLSSGNYTVSMSVSDASTGCSTTTSQTLGVSLCGIEVSFDLSSNGLNAFFNGYVTTDSTNGQTATWLWSFPGGSPSSSTNQNAGVTYSSLGVQSACLYVTTNTGCVDTVCRSFTLTPPVFSISGQITAGGSGACGAVYLIVQDSIGHLALVDSVLNQVDSNTCIGNYGFNYLPVDTYYVKAALEPNDPNYADYLPTYYGNVLTWGTATPVYLTSGNNSSVNIDLTAGSNPGGPGFVGGYVNQGAGLIIGGNQGNGTTATGGIGGNDQKSVGQPLTGVQINLLTSGDQAVAYTFTDANGHYQFAHLALGSYKIYAEELNKVPTPIPFTLTQENPTDSTADISINSHSATGIDALTNIQINNVYPNPVVTVLGLQLTSTQSTEATMKLVDVLGRTILAQNIKLSTGQNTEEINMETLAAGVYQLVIQTDSKQITYKVVKAR